MKFNRKLIIGGVIAALLIILLAWQLFFSGEDAPQLLTGKVARGNIEQTVEATGTLEPKEMVSVGAQASGRVTKLTVNVGDTVKQGQLIAQIDSQTQDNDLKTAQAELANVRAERASADATLAQKRLAFRRQQQLVAGEATSHADYEAAEAEYKAAQANVAAVDAQIRQSQINADNAVVDVGYTRVVAPMDGVVVAVVTKQGQTVNANQSAPTIVILAKLDVMTIEAEISEADVIKVDPGQQVYFTILGDSETRYNAVLRQVEPAPESIVDEVDSSSSSSSSSSSDSAIYYNALFDADNPDGILRALMTANVTIILESKKNVLTVPSAALGQKGKDGNYAVRVVNDKGEVSTKQVKIGLNNNVSAEVLSGLKLNETVVIGESTGGEEKASTKSGFGGRGMGGPPR